MSIFGWFRHKHEQEEEEARRYRMPDPMKVYAEQKRSDLSKRIAALELQYQAAAREEPE
jgi:hypothetical protein